MKNFNAVPCVVLAALLAQPAVIGGTASAEGAGSRLMLVALGDSLTHGTMNATNNSVNTQNAYLQRVADKLAAVTSLRFTQPLYDFDEKRLKPFVIPTNLGVDGADSFTMEGLEYYKRAGLPQNTLSPGLMCDRAFLSQQADDYDKVLYPINLLAHKDVSQVDAAVWTLTQGVKLQRADKALVVLWIGNNDSSSAALGRGGASPEFEPLPYHQVKSKLKPGLRYLLNYGERTGQVSFEPYTQAAIERNLTDLSDFTAQFDHLLSRLTTETAASTADVEWLVLTLAYYSAVGYLIDSEDLEFYIGKYIDGYAVPASFARVADPGQPITDPLRGDRVSLLTFGFMVSMAATCTGTPSACAAEVNSVLDDGGTQRDGLVLSQAEQQFIMGRIDGFNAAIRSTAAAYGPKVHVLDIGPFLNQGLTGASPIFAGSKQLTRKWARGASFSLDGVHPGYTAQSLIANFVLDSINNLFGLGAPTYDLGQVLDTDPYYDRDGDGWVPGTSDPASGIAELLNVLRDTDDDDPSVQAQVPADIWDRISDILLHSLLGIPGVRQEAERMGIRPAQRVLPLTSARVGK